ncbi:Maf family protein [Rossellomorea sp. BNER]|nr:Maf family protein [Rossellomorea sp. BNER]
MSNLILASSSPRRKMLLQQLHLDFSIIHSNVDESIDRMKGPEYVVTELAARKARAVASDYHSSYVIGSDTVVALDGHILEKPKDEEEAKKMLSQLSGKTHSVFTGVAIIIEGQQEVFYEKTDVTFWELTEQEILNYIETGEPYDKAGGYGIQALGALFVKEIKGDYASVVGLPISKLYRKLKKLGFPSLRV